MDFIVNITFADGVKIKQFVKSTEFGTFYCMLDDSILEFSIDLVGGTWEPNERSELYDLYMIDRSIGLWQRGKKLEAINTIRYMFNTTACTVDFINDSIMDWMMGAKVGRIQDWWSIK